MTTGHSQEYVKEYLRASEQTLEEARVLVERKLLKGAVNRAYYAIFYAVRAALTSLKGSGGMDRRLLSSLAASGLILLAPFALLLSLLLIPDINPSFVLPREHFYSKAASR